jgi:hypothetical protein
MQFGIKRRALGPPGQRQLKVGRLCERLAGAAKPRPQAEA